MTAPTLGQAAHDAMHALCRKTGDPCRSWEEIGPRLREKWEAAAQAVLNDAFPGLREQVRLAHADRDQLRKHVLTLAASLENSAAQTAPSKKSGIENDLAVKLRQVAEPPA